VKSRSVARGNGVDDDLAELNAAFGAGPGYLPPGVHNLSGPLEKVERIVIDPRATIKPTATMSSVLRTRIGTRLDRGLIIGGGTIDAGTVADVAIHLRDFLHYTVDGVQVRGGKAAGLQAGQAGSSGRSAEAVLSNLRFIHDGPIPADSRAILVENSGDHSISQVLAQNYEYGLTLPAGGNAVVQGMHAWAEPSKGSMRVGFEDRSNNSQHSGCHADTRSEFGWQLFGYQTTLVQCGTYNNPTAGRATDDMMVGVRFERANAIATLIGHYFLGGFPTKRLKADIEAADGNYGLIQTFGCSNQHVTTARSLTNRAISQRLRDELSSGKGVVADAIGGALAGLALRISTDGKKRWELVFDGAQRAASTPAAACCCAATTTRALSSATSSSSPAPRAPGCGRPTSCWRRGATSPSARPLAASSAPMPREGMPLAQKGGLLGVPGQDVGDSGRT
jgi:hypothetical protein